MYRREIVDHHIARCAARQASYAKDNVHLRHLARTLPVVTAVSNNANGTDILDAAAAAALTWYPLTDTAGADNTSYIDPATAAALVAAVHAAMGVRDTGYITPPDADTAFYGLRGGVVVHGVRANLEMSRETSDAWATNTGFFEKEFWPWKSPCADTGHSVMVAAGELRVARFPSFDARSDILATVPVTVMGTTEEVPAYASTCDFDGAAAGAAAGAVACAAGVLTALRVEVAFTPVAGSVFGAWRVVRLEPSYAVAGGAAGEHFTGAETEVASSFGVNATRMLRVTLRDAGAPEAFSAPALGTAGKIHIILALFAVGILAAPVQPLLMRLVTYNVAINEGKPPPYWREMIQYRGW